MSDTEDPVAETADVENHELSMAQKLEMTRTAMPKGIGVGYAGLDNSNKPLDMDPPEAFTSETTIVENEQGDQPLPPEEFEPSGGGDESIHPFKIIIVDATTWRLETEGSSITNDDDKSEIAITDLGINRTDLGHIYIKSSTLGAGNEPDGTADVVVSDTVLDEIEYLTGDQVSHRLYIGEVRQKAGGASLEKSQAWDDAALLSRQFDAGTLVWSCIGYPSHPDSLTAGN